MKENWPNTILYFLFLVCMLSLMVWCTGCTPHQPPDANKAIVVKQSPRVMAEHVAIINQARERGGR